MPQLPESAAGQQDLAFMQMALALAGEAAQAGEVPVGAVVVKDGVVIGRGRNHPIESCDPSAHAEMQALREAATALGNYRLDNCTLYVTLEPCAMCSGAILHSRVQRVVFGAADPKTGCAGSVLNLFAHPQINHQTQVEGGLLAEQSGQRLQDFFQQRRRELRRLSNALREDALRTPERSFENLTGYPWAPHYLSDLPGLANLRMHYLDEGPSDSASVFLCLHPIPGWSYCYKELIPEWLTQGARVVLPDLVGFGKSDKPKREDAHSVEFHCRYLLELLQRLDLKRCTLVAPDATHPLMARLRELAATHISGLLLQPLHGPPASDAECAALDSPFPDAGHRAAIRAFASNRIR
jgi:tRNA(adenine34) deaminase